MLPQLLQNPVQIQTFGESKTKGAEAPKSESVPAK
jgi:hypothetical protein